MALCTALAVSHPDTENVLRCFKEDISRLNSNTPEMENNNYVLGIKAVYEYLELVIKQTMLDISLLAKETTAIEH